ncbi:MAG: hypothetical protein MI753_00735 [Hyphomicrobiales bacterium]|nr:hypothetical protein [Hyphomicrobiales bacterium]
MTNDRLTSGQSDAEGDNEECETCSLRVPRLKGDFGPPRPLPEPTPDKWSPVTPEAFKPVIVTPPVHPIANVLRSGPVYRKVTWDPENEMWIQKSFWIYIATAVGISLTLTFIAVLAGMTVFAVFAGMLSWFV